MAQPRTDQHRSRVTIRERPYHTRPAANLAVQPFNHIVGADASPMLAWEVAVGQRFLDWGITFDEPYQIEERANRKIAYADRDELIRSIMKKYPPKESLERPRSRVRRDAPTQEQAASNKSEALHVPNKEDYS